jgi:hypothetical protein
MISGFFSLTAGKLPASLEQQAALLAASGQAGCQNAAAVFDLWRLG